MLKAHRFEGRSCRDRLGQLGTLVLKLLREPPKEDYQSVTTILYLLYKTYIITFTSTSMNSISSTMNM